MFYTVNMFQIRLNFIKQSPHVVKPDMSHLGKTVIYSSKIKEIQLNRLPLAIIWNSMVQQFLGSRLSFIRKNLLRTSMNIFQYSNLSHLRLITWHLVINFRSPSKLARHAPSSTWFVRISLLNVGRGSKFESPLPS